jgi:histidinol-phosphate aminotransferase
VTTEFKTKDYIESIAPYKQGKSIIDNAQKGTPTKLSSNENALKTSPKALEAYRSHKELNRYADGSCQELRAAIGNKYNIDKDTIVCGAGSDEIISLLIESFAGPGDEVIYSEHGFLMYQISTKKFGAKAIAAKETNLTTNVDNILGLISKETKMIFIANPNNPTGSYINKKEIEKLINKTPKNIIIVLDLAYAEFVELSEEDYPNVSSLVTNNDNVVMTRTFSKIHGLASLRLGWSYSCSYIAQVLNKVRGPFNVSGAAMEAGIAAINDDDFIEKSIKHNNKWLKILKDELDRINLKSHPSIANFILIDFLDDNKCQQANDFLLHNNIIVRQMVDYKLPTCLRITIGTEQENRSVIGLLEEFQNKD